MIPFLTRYIQSLSHQDAVTISLILANSLVVLKVTAFMYILWEIYNNWKEKHNEQMEIEDEPNSDKEHVVYEYGTKECAIEIRHYANPTLAEFLRHLRALSWERSMSKQEFDEITSNLLAYMKSKHHPNTPDVDMTVYRILHKSEFSNYEVDYAYAWLHIARTYWLVYPQNTMIPFETTEIEEAANIAEEKEYRSMSF